MNNIKAMRRFMLAGLSVLSANALASYQMHHSGPMLNLAKAAHPSSVLAFSYNPAAGESLIHDEESMRMGYFANIGIQGEIGDLDNAEELIDDLRDDLERDDLTISEALNTQATYNNVLGPKLEEDARFTVTSSVHAPLTPVAFRSETLGGVISLGLQGSVIADMQYLFDPISINVSGTSISLDTASAVYGKAATLVTGTVGYSREIWRPEFLPTSQVHAGFHTNIYHASLNKQVIALENILDDEDIGEAVRDELDENTESSTEVGIDLGFLLTSNYYQVGITFANINEPEFDFGAIGQNCNEISDPVRRSNCTIAEQVYADRIDLTETAVMDAQTIIEGAVYTKDKTWLLAASADLNSVYDFVGRETQYISASASYFSDSYTIPGARVSLSTNLKGSELTTFGVGTTLFGVMNIDLAWSIFDKVEVDGTDYPRTFGFNIGFEEKF